MTTPAADDWAVLGTTWRVGGAESFDVGDFLRRERRHRWRMRLIVAIEVLVSAAAIGLALLARGTWSEPAGTLWALSVFVYVGVVWAFATWNRRGTWRPLTETTEAYLAISILRCRRGLRAVRFVVAVVVVQLAAGLGWVVLRRIGGQDPLTSRGASGLLLLAALAAGYLAWTIWYRRRMLSELAWLEELQRVLAG